MKKTKILSLFLFTVIMSVMVVSAVDFSISKSSIDFKKPAASATFKITPTGTADYELVFPEILDEEGNKIIFSSPTDLTGINDTTSVVINASFDYSQLTLGKVYSGDLIIQEISNITNNKSIELSFMDSYCIEGCNGEDLLEIDIEIDNTEGFGEEDTEWYPLDEIELDINVENLADDTIDDIVIEWCLYSIEEGDCVIEDEEPDFKLKEDKDKDVLISFQVDPNDLDKDADFSKISVPSSARSFLLITTLSLGTGLLAVN